MRHAESGRIMIVDDEPCIADTLAIIFRNAGYDAVAYYDGRSALEACTARTPDLLISDVLMPGINGFDLAILIGQQCPGCKIVLFSGLGASFDLVEEAKCHGYDFEILEKPVHPVELLQTVAAALADGPSLQHPKLRFRA
jgi:DNA-binding NtrC family response regulator